MPNLRKTWELLLDIFFPPLCLGCRKYLSEKEKPDLICNSCFSNIEIYKNLFRPSPNFILAAAASYENKALRELIHYFKYESFLQAKKPLGEILIKYLKNLNLNLKDYIVVPVPLHVSRKRKRGFNQAAILAEIVSENFGCKLETNILKRIKETRSQIELTDYKARYENLKNSFVINEKSAHLIKGRRILLVDDVYTSGATINEAIKVLHRAGADKIIAVTVAKAV